MKVATLVVLGAIAILGQVTVAPGFPIAGAVFSFPLILLVLIAGFGGPTSAMIAIPLVAVALGFVSDRSPALLLLGFLPLLPLGLVVEELRLPLSPFLQTLIVGAATGIWLRAVLAAAVMVQGAGFHAALFTKVLLPGAVLDVALLALVYAALRLIGLERRSMTLSQGGFLLHE